MVYAKIKAVVDLKIPDDIEQSASEQDIKDYIDIHNTMLRFLPMQLKFYEELNAIDDKIDFHLGSIYIK